MREPRFPSLAKRRKALAVGAVALGLVALAACNPAPDKKAQNVVIVGSDTTQTAMATLTTNYNASAKNTDPDSVYNILALQTPAKTVPADSQGDCVSTTYDTPAGVGETLAPNGSSAGRDALKASVANGDGCISVSRSSAAPRAIGTTAGTDNSTFEYYAFALDAVGWGSASTLAPSNLTLAQLQGIYNCTFTDWSQVGGTAGPIQRYYPQSGSGTRSFFQSSVLGFDPTTFSSGSCPAVKISEENTPGITILANGDTQKAIAPMSAGVWSAQANGTYPDDRHGFAIKSLNGEPTAVKVGSTYGLNTPAFSGDSGAPVVESNVLLNTPTPAYPGVRYVFNVVDNTSKLYSQAMLMVGFTNAASGWKGDICSGAEASTIGLYFAPLDTSADGTHNAAGSNCRLYTP
jgi:phosphate transport system substrate-binding protein